MRKLFYVVPIMSGLLSYADTQTMYGMVDLNHADIKQEVKVLGKAKLKDSNIHRSIHVWGTLSADKTVFGQDIHVRGNDVSLNESVVEGDVLLTNYLKQPCIKLNGTTVNGDVVFNSRQKGKVIKDATTQIRGDIKHGVVDE